MEPETPLIDANDIKSQINNNVKNDNQLLLKILKKGIDEDTLNKLENIIIEPKILEELKNVPIDVRVSSLEELVIRLLFRVKRLERENEYRYLEQINIMSKMEKIIKLIPVIEQLNNHFFGPRRTK